MVLKLRSLMSPLLAVFGLMSVIAVSYQNCTPMEVDPSLKTSGSSTILNDPNKCLAATVDWTDRGDINGKRCSTMLPESANNSQQTARDVDAMYDGNTGTAVYNCINGFWLHALGGVDSCTTTGTVTPAPTGACSPQRIAWTVNGVSCEGYSTGVVLNGATIPGVSDSTQPTTGYTNAVCVNGNLNLSGNQICVAQSTGTVGASCSAVNSQSWLTNCSGPIAAATNGADAPLVTNMAAGYDGNATYTCVNGSFQLKANPAPSCVARNTGGGTAARCLATTKTWTSADGSKSCTGSIPETASGSIGQVSHSGSATVTGSASYSCTTGSFATLPSSSSCTATGGATPVVKCPATTFSWLVQDVSFVTSVSNANGKAYLCRGQVGEAAVGTIARIPSNNGPNLGSVDVNCDNVNGQGVWRTQTPGAYSGSTCSPANSEPPSGAKLLRALTKGDPSGLIGLNRVTRTDKAGDFLFSQSLTEGTSAGYANLSLGFSTITVPGAGDYNCVSDTVFVTDPGADLPIKPLYRCRNSGGHFVTDDKTCEGATLEKTLGCIYKPGISTADVVSKGNFLLRLVPLKRCKSSAADGNSRVYDLVTPDAAECDYVKKIQNNGTGVNGTGGSESILGSFLAPL